jgi:hypothetical protein
VRRLFSSVIQPRTCAFAISINDTIITEAMNYVDIEHNKLSHYFYSVLYILQNTRIAQSSFASQQADYVRILPFLTLLKINLKIGLS